MFIKNNLRIINALGLSLILMSCGESDVPAAELSSPCLSADMVLHNTKIYTANDAQWTAEAAAVLADKIIF